MKFRNYKIAILTLHCLLAVALVSTSGCSAQTKSGCQTGSFICCAIFTPDSKYIVAGGYSDLALLDFQHNKLVDRFHIKKQRTVWETPAADVLALSPDGTIVASASDGNAIKIWDFQSGNVVRSFDIGRTEILSLAISANSKLLAAGTGCRITKSGKPAEYQAVYEIWLWDLTKSESEPIRLVHESPVDDLVFSHDGKRIISLTNKRTMRIYNVEAQKELKRLQFEELPLGMPAPGEKFTGFDRGASMVLGNGPRRSLTLSADGKHLVLGRTVWNSETLELEYFTDGRRLWKDFDEWQRVNLQQPISKKDTLPGLIDWFTLGYLGALTPDSRRLIVAGPYGVVVNKAMLTNEGKQLTALTTMRGRKLSTGCESQLAVFDVSSGELVYEDQVFLNGASVSSLAASPDGKYVVAAGSGRTAGVGGAVVVDDPYNLYVYRLPACSAAPK